MNSNNLITFVTILLSIWLINHLFDEPDDELDDVKHKIRELEDQVHKLEDKK